MVTASLLTATLLPCFRLGLFGACAAIAGGAEEASGAGFASPRNVMTPYGAAGLRAFVDLPLDRRFALRIHGDFDVPFTRATLFVGSAEVWSTPPFEGALGLAATYLLP
ncbi:MAG: hypothetical protein ACYDCL_07155 [Myxococcales bacterium]